MCSNKITDNGRRKPFGCLLLNSCILAFGLLLSAVRAEDSKDKFDAPAVFGKPVPESIDDLKAMERHLDKVLARVLPSIVCVNGQGSGVIVSKDGYVLTAAHVIAGQTGRECTLTFSDGTTVKAKALYTNPNVDSGLIKIEEDGKDWPFVEMGHSADLKPGDWCIARGHPGGFKKGRDPVVRLGRITKPEATMLVHDCALVGGDSGGPLFDISGRVIGIESRIDQSVETNIAVPVDVFRDGWDQLVEAGLKLGRTAPAYAPKHPITAGKFGAEKRAYGPQPNVIVLAREVTDPLSTLLSQLDEIAKDQDSSLDSFFILVGKGKELDPKDTEDMEGKLKELVEKHELRNTTVSVEPAARVESFHVSKLKDITVVVAANGSVKGFYTFNNADFKADTTEKLLNDLKKVIDEWHAKKKKKDKG
jgi:S1-C subfamily serine protease